MPSLATPCRSLDYLRFGGTCLPTVTVRVPIFRLLMVMSNDGSGVIPKSSSILANLPASGKRLQITHASRTACKHKPIISGSRRPDRVREQERGRGWGREGVMLLCD